MSSPSQLRGAAVARFLKGITAIVSPLIGILVLVGWARGIPAAMSVIPGLSKMAPNTALGLILSGVALSLLHPRALAPARRAVGVACAGALILLGVLTLLQVLLIPWLGSQNVLLLWANGPAQNAPPLTAPSTALSFTLLGGTLLLLGREAPLSAYWTDTPIICVMLVALFEFNGRLHGAIADSPDAPYAGGMGLHTSLVLMLLGASILCTRPEKGLMGQLTRDTLGGFLARRLVPVSILGPTLVGVVLELFHREDIFSLPTKAALFSTVMSLGGAAIVFLSAQALNRIDVERRHANASLRASEERFRGLLETAPEAVITVDATGHVRFVNAQAEHLFGYPREELISQDVEQLVPGLLREMSPLWSTVSASASPVHNPGPRVALRSRHKSGKELPVEVILGVFTMPEGTTVTALIRDMTEHEQYLEGLQIARAEAERERALLEAVVEHAPVGIFFVDPTTDEMRLNASFQNMLGADPSPQRTQYLGTLRHPDGKPVRFEELPSTRALEGQDVPPERYVFNHPEGPVPVLVSAAPVRVITDEIRGVIVCIQDISAHEELEHLREEYVGLISHDLRTPLQNILLRCQLLLRSLQAKGLTSEVTAAEALLRNTRWMSGMVEELLEGSRFESGQVELHLERMDLSRFIEEVIERDVPPDARERLRLEVATPVPWVPVDAPRLERVLVNLITNALKYSTAGTPVVLRLEQEEGMARISVMDQGKGLQPEEADRLFTKYYRTHEGRRVEGVGLGLYISRLIIEAHGGHIRVDSTPGKGSTFHFTLPLAAAGRDERQQRVADGRPPQSS
ncbi:sensor histidine kinase [Hyalangium versicolor]|uniref:sensor histidine kinase n=1 Tax=Hyalangium versicolor TaxID=2861190 RepID=UPI001CD0062A|nr:ATP-binding protein [Hyalangium versicolor]